MTKEKERYLSPEAEVLEVRLEGVMALSPGDYSEWKEEEA